MDFSFMRSLQLFGDRDLRITEMDAPPPPAPGEVQVRVQALALNFLDVWGFRGMAFAKRKMPQAVGVEASGEIAAVGEGVTRFKAGDPVTMYGAETCGHCAACRKGWDNLCENVAGIMGFHIDGFARELINRPERLVIPVPKGVSFEQAACAPIGFGTVQHMLFDNAKLEPGESILVHAGGSGIGTAAVKMAKAIGCTVYATVGDDVVFEHVGADTWNGSLLCLKRGGRLVTCGSTSGVSATINLMQLFQQQYRIFGSFGCTMRNIRESLDKMAAGITPVIDTVFPPGDYAQGLERLEARKVFGKILVAF